jgi:excisionase family DNA binding protein
MINGYHHGCRPQALGTGSTAEIHRVPEIGKHVAFALSHHVRRLHREALPVPGEVEELAHFLKHLARIRQGSSTLADEVATAQYAFMPDRLLVTKGEAAQRLCVSVRTIERLVATGRLPQVRVERLARFRVRDLEAYVNSLGENHASDDPGNDEGRPHDLVR